jgi:2-aminoadipate transaminase
MKIRESVDWERALARRARGDAATGLMDILALANAEGIISFSGGFPDPSTFPGPVLAEILGDLITAGDASALQYSPTQGLPGPLAFVRRRLARLEGLEPGDGELMLTSGAIEGLELVSKAFLDPGDLAIVEGPTYLGSIMAFRGFEADIVAVPMDADGFDVETLEDQIARRGRPKLLYTIPDYQNPAGISMTLERRTALVQSARRHGILIVEDVAYRELGFDDARLPSLWSLAPDTVVQLGTFSKTFFPGVRLGWASGPRGIISHLVLAKQNTDQCAGSMGQRLLEEYGQRGHLEEQNRRARHLYRRRCDLLMDALAETMPPEVAFTRPRGGFFTWLTLPQKVDTVALAPLAMQSGVAYVPGTPFYPDGRGRNEVRLAFSKVNDDLIAEGARRLSDLFKRALREQE